jgi:hypothetical protein
MAKTYQVFYWIKKNRHEYLEHMFVPANNAKDACRICKELVKERTGRNAFRPSTKAPDLEALRHLPYYVID